MIDYLSFFLFPSQSSNTPFYPQSFVNQGACPNFLLFAVFTSDSHLSLLRSLGPHHLWTISLVQEYDWISVALMNDCPFQECNQNLVALANEWPCPRLGLNFGHPYKGSTLSKNAIEIVHPYLGSNQPWSRSATKFRSDRQVIAPIQECDLNFPPLSK